MSPSGDAWPVCGRSALLMRRILQPVRRAATGARVPIQSDGEGEVEVLTVAAALAFELHDDEALVVVDESLARRLAARATPATVAGHVGEVAFDLAFGAQAYGRFGLRAGQCARSRRCEGGEAGRGAVLQPEVEDQQGGGDEGEPVEPVERAPQNRPRRHGR